MEVKWTPGSGTASAGGPWACLAIEPPRSPTILIIHNGDTHPENLRALLEDDGRQVVCANGTSDGLETLSQRPIDLVLLDMLLPDGVESCRRIRSNRLRDLIPVLMLSPAAT